MKERLNTNELVMTLATAVMAVATIVMMYSGCQQTRIADATEKLSRNQEEIKLLSAKKELRRVAREVLDVLSNNGDGIHKLKTKQECLQVARRVRDLMDSASDNYYLLNNADQAKTWNDAIEGFEFYLDPKFIDHEVTFVGPTNVDRHFLTDDEMTDMFFNECKQDFFRFCQVYYRLDLKELMPLPKTSEIKNKR
ncbi:MAG: hypothetical protein ABSC89_00625 [Verrucomicrobiota bacterium]|jgi:hypothetical protein